MTTCLYEHCYNNVPVVKRLIKINIFSSEVVDEIDGKICLSLQWWFVSILDPQIIIPAVHQWKWQVINHLENIFKSNKVFPWLPIKFNYCFLCNFSKYTIWTISAWLSSESIIWDMNLFLVTLVNTWCTMHLSLSIMFYHGAFFTACFFTGECSFN